MPLRNIMLRAAKAMMDLHVGRQRIMQFAREDLAAGVHAKLVQGCASANPESPEVSGYLTAVQVTTEAAFMGYVLRLLNYDVYGKRSTKLVAWARDELIQSAGRERARVLLQLAGGSPQHSTMQGETCRGLQGQVAKSIAMLWALRSMVSVMPGVWGPCGLATDDDKATGAPSSSSSSSCEEWKVCSEWRRTLVGEDASMLLAALEAYQLLPGRSHHVPRREQGEVSTTHAMDTGATHTSTVGRSRWQVQPHASPDDYYRSLHFARVERHGPMAWDDCFLLLMMQERALNVDAVMVHGGEHAKTDAVNSSGSAVDGSGGELDMRPLQATNGDNRTAFSLFEIEFQVLKLFLMYNAVFAGNMGASNVCYLEDRLSSYVQDATVQIAGAAASHAAASPSPRKRKLQAARCGSGGDAAA